MGLPRFEDGARRPDRYPVSDVPRGGAIGVTKAGLYALSRGRVGPLRSGWPPTLL
jgi:hypothetical protein